MAAFLAEKQKYEGAAFVIVYIFLYGLLSKHASQPVEIREAARTFPYYL